MPKSFLLIDGSNLYHKLKELNLENLDKLFLISSDTDLEYEGFSHKPSLALIKNCSSSRLLRKEDLVKMLN